ncbi:ABC transporter substrate-binding protein [Mesoaciditoga lauensis]|uniref:ABC transporter substrate-binding protein n=1 Tax=Mesoaciditoga lauensis TaxID=1495039 RepID=UPI0006898196|nr:ABC transporter substrate-binding protein [Mesoaciditoga lauensis]
MKRQRSVLLISLIIMGLLLVGITSFGQTKPMKDISVFYIVKASNSYYWQIMMNGASLAAKDLGIKITFQEPVAESDISKEVSILNDAIAIHPDAIVIAPTVTDALTTGIVKAMREGIKVIIVDSAANTNDYVLFTASDNYAAGEKLAKEFVELIKTKTGQDNPTGNIAYMTSMAGAQWAVARDGGFLAGIKKYAPGLKVVAHQVPMNNLERATSQWQNIFTAHPNLVGAFADNNVTGDALARALALSGLAGKMVAVAFDNDPAEITALSKGILNALMVQAPWSEGYNSVFYAVSAVEGVQLPKIIYTPTTIALKSNMNSPEVQAVLNPIEFHKNWK